MYSSFDMPSTFKFPCTRKTPYDGNHDTTYLYNTYYQWVSIFLAFQAGLFYIPRCIWLIMEGGLMAFIVNGMKIIIIIFKNLEFIMSRKKKWLHYCLGLFCGLFELFIDFILIRLLALSQRQLFLLSTGLSFYLNISFSFVSSFNFLSVFQFRPFV